jgi:hypothetical protein
VKTARFGSLCATHLVFPVASEISAAHPGLNFDRHKVRELRLPDQSTSWSGTRQVLYSITKHAMRRSADEMGATSISFRPKVFSDPATQPSPISDEKTPAAADDVHVFLVVISEYLFARCLQ